MWSERAGGKKGRVSAKCSFLLECQSKRSFRVTGLCCCSPAGAHARFLAGPHFYRVEFITSRSLPTSNCSCSQKASANHRAGIARPMDAEKHPLRMLGCHCDKADIKNESEQARLLVSHRRRALKAISRRSQNFISHAGGAPDPSKSLARGAEFRRCSTSTHHPRLNPEFLPTHHHHRHHHRHPHTSQTPHSAQQSIVSMRSQRSLGLYSLALVVLALCAAVSAQNPASSTQAPASTNAQASGSGE